MNIMQFLFEKAAWEKKLWIIFYYTEPNKMNIQFSYVHINRVDEKGQEKLNGLKFHHFNIIFLLYFMQIIVNDIWEMETYTLTQRT